jgi:hypothetical protein
MSDSYFLHKNNQQLGPFPIKELIEGLHAGRFESKDMVWKEGMTEWTVLSAVVPPPPKLGAGPPPLSSRSGSVVDSISNQTAKKMGCGKLLGYAFLFLIVCAIVGIMTEKNGKSSGSTRSYEREDSDKKGESNKAGSDNGRFTSIGKMGEAFKLGDYTYTIDSAQKTSVIGGSQFEEAFTEALLKDAFRQIGGNPAAPAGDAPAYLVVRYTIRNDSNEAAVVSTSDFKVEDSRGRIFTPSSEATSQLVMNGSADLLVSQLQLGIAKEGVQAFELPNDSFRSAITLIVPEKGFLNSGETRVKLVVNK